MAQNVDEQMMRDLDGQVVRGIRSKAFGLAITGIMFWGLVAAAASASVVWYPEHVVIVLVVLGLVQIGRWVHIWIDSKWEFGMTSLPFIAAWIVFETTAITSTRFSGWGEALFIVLCTSLFSCLALFPLLVGASLREKNSERIKRLERRLRDAGDVRSEGEEALERCLRDAGIEYRPSQEQARNEGEASDYEERLT